jgi:hypothetical protein
MNDDDDEKNKWFKGTYPHRNVGTCEPPPAITTSFITIENRVGSR